MPRNPNRIDYTKGFPLGFESFETIADPRIGNHKLHHFGEILFMAFSAILCGVRSYEMMEEFCYQSRDWLEKWLKLPNGIPCANTFARVFQAIEPEDFAQCIIIHLEQLGFHGLAAQIAIDGKAMRGSRSGEKSHVHAVSAWACNEGLTLAQTFVGEKSNEITAIPELLDLLNLKGSVVTIDAMGTQRAIAEKIVTKEGDYILAVKGNQGSLHDEVRDQFDFATHQLDLKKLDPAKWSLTSTQETGHDRSETRAILVCHQLDWMDEKIRKAWSGLGSIIMVHRRTLLGAGKIREEVSYYMSSLTDIRADEMLSYIRGHWKIENNCHWVLDAIYREDHNQTRERNSACNLATLRRMALNAHNQLAEKAKKYKSLPKRELRALKDEAYLEELLSLV